MPLPTSSETTTASIRDWFFGARPQTLPVAVTSVLAGTAIAATAGAVSWPKAALALITVIGVQAGANYANDYFDGIKGTDKVRVGPARLVASKLAPPRQVLLAAILCLAVAAVSGIILAVTSDSRLLIVGAVCLIAAWTYTGGPKPYAYLGLGEIMVFLFFGPVAVSGVVYVQAGSLNGLWVTTLAAGTGVGILTAAVMLTNNLRDIETDRDVGKITLAGVIGDKKSRLLYMAFLGIALACLGIVAMQGFPLVLLGLVYLIFAVPAGVSVIRGAQGRDLVPVLARTSLAELLWGAGLFAGALLA
ncbi:1,4-dihydroxy-2-naphthoate polyprenyltransferase (plasmid) [Arthrobacter sp. zg-Y820]|uniref:1,4-dihydroxy-2-naphthoate polyprenyltransferase n=1 Tax=unclassified Arthrobacter TaxID=235627 RepID=UPI001E5667CF|nr:MULTISPECIES: 1,4-dihydroxy-2-naphthoate polyprenyltransferase [unclassified Arthrobacter]MCC9198501.1 1,4-dihydroxy-2-naphthoate polyprenyltransferase [Arthrobacter sp. zg-Y820]MDK1281371.1 1,4-dihydroxy-2-naphthoate polyprenyltransferase [Arthrobacter sp. zg.Y820]WIB11237.1 1,4-dihydroxy-2-naphthoate polyprenyltransferase [Arthrobacter sp. zg-Y820]